MKFKDYAITTVMILALGSFGLAALLPVYTDEIFWKLVQGRLGYDGFQVRSGTMMPSCGPDAFSIPVSLLPFRLLDTLMYQWISNPLEIRLFGMGLFILWLVGTWQLFQRIVPQPADRSTVAGAAIAVVTLGIMPFLMVISRPEQPLLIGITVLLLICMGEAAAAPRTLSREILVAVALVLGSGFVLAAHQRAIFAVPLMALSAIKLLRRRAIVVGAIFVIGYIAVAAYRHWTARWACPDDPYADSFFQMNSIGAAAASGNLLLYLKELAKLLIYRPGHFFFLSQFGFFSVHTSGMVPDYPWRGVGLSLTLAIAGFVGTMSICGFVAFLVLAVEALRRRRAPIAILALASVWALLFASLFARASRSDYEAALLEPLLGLVSVSSMWAARDPLSRWLGAIRFRRFAYSALNVLLILSIASQIALIAGYLHNIAGSWIAAGYPQGQRYSVANLGYGGLAPKILNAAAMCGIDPKSHPHHLVVDELTYFALRQAHQPFLMTYLSDEFWGKGIGDIRAMLTRERSAGMVVGCQWVPRPLEADAIVNGVFCCVPSFGG